MICILPGGGASWGAQATYRYWPTSHFAKLADRLIEQYKANIFIIGSFSEKKLCKEVTEYMKYPGIDLSGQTTLHQLGALMKQCHLVIGSESGPLHLATALNCPTLPIYGPVDENVYGPHIEKTLQRSFYSFIACRPCYKNFSMPQCHNRICLAELDLHPMLNQINSIINTQAISYDNSSTL
ncbi:MAG: glycosyltransferase family 9 protein [Deltaproteobacteria bacterium]|nr:glycosyltransferase family 9 protein [Deltaproteobacteria bacterium]